ncbi:hypothetical protein FQN55_001823 [Onygenales sp. PD_40]|nr:hypothetical protein FQN55_001823 [Onygenales sp. PD_40]KAK2779831.1 hypothetical protein FQN53_001259 [Emmonsiellopsis sp. PD_33]
MPTLTDLPFELLLLIFSDLTLGDFCALSYTSRAMPALVKPFLYKNINFTWYGNERDSLSRSPSNARMRNLLLSVVRGPKKALWTEHLTLGSYDASAETAWEDGWVPDPTDEALIRDVAIRPLHRLGQKRQEIWTEALRQGNSAILAALLVLQLPKLKSLRLELCGMTNWLGGFLSNIVDCSMAQETGIPSNSILYNLENVELTTKNHSAVLDYNIYFLCRLPSIKSIDIDILMECDPQRSYRLGPSTITELTWRDPGQQSYRLKPLLAQATSLKSLTYYNRPYPNGMAAMCDVLGSALEPVSETLEHLVLYLPLQTPNHNSTNRAFRGFGNMYMGTIGTIEHLTRLETAEIPLEILFTDSTIHSICFLLILKFTLPKERLRKLCLSASAGWESKWGKWEETCIKLVGGYLQDSPKRRAPLEELVIKLYDLEGELPQELVRICSDAGVVCSLVHVSGFWNQ